MIAWKTQQLFVDENCCDRYSYKKTFVKASLETENSSI